ncbi:MAG: septation ring formation regulator EzrA [Candidatus Thiodiazotropha endolucinida]|nr:septation ring formation regulator EzrA [Candidatus Thiodiazotropha taylori]MCG8095351.1 septation ring formation regulator EzrA [Candidatus Thiodiazotropha endolucinida]MCG7892620.1 septation ring formation regulator EzrA [Candidatus Thiodiazotropha taylori]MCG7953327.1 septation ring formation regulator EzrA [Candidatus Thiodiazotropha taylori]MCG8058400.1 septation ring formation regulator EzrA [Candidatus Thiodiazotropha taylori]
MRDCCKDHDGKPKQKYPTESEANNAAEALRDEGESIRVYRCEDGDGWHLTSQNAPPPERPKNVMTREDKKLYSQDSYSRNRTRRKENSLGSLLNDEALSQMKAEAEKNTLDILKKKLEPLQEDFNVKHRLHGQLLKQCRQAERNGENLSEIHEQLSVAKEDEAEARKKLRAMKKEIEAAKRRLQVVPK